MSVASKTMFRSCTSATREKREKLGQFFTVVPVADFMASLFGNLPPTVRLLDAGAGAGVLTKAFVARCCKKNDGVRAIETTLYEIDSSILNTLSETMRECERLCAQTGIRFSFTIHASDFIQEISERLAGGWFNLPIPVFDAAIVNPPYRKIGVASKERAALRSVGVETGNLYSGFVALVQRLLAPGGQLVAITPRSFCNGPYFYSFRVDFLKNMELRRLHVFESRRDIFRNDGILQENIIFHATRGHAQPHEVVVSYSQGAHLENTSKAVFDFPKIVHPDDNEVFIHIPSPTSHASAQKTMSSLDSSLVSLGLAVSTGRIVDFRLQDALREQPERGTVPL
ncbi:MAG: Eco57I restriction-modification methylase domain-containing protein, partial [Opitutaceae bacterium]|nr:Eco57I restriction-modification methylase domain-containing protein [Opitutaceae bacterium]